MKHLPKLFFCHLALLAGLQLGCDSHHSASLTMDTNGTTQEKPWNRSGDGATKWSRLDRQTIKFEGSIESPSDIAALKAILQPGDRVLVVDSGGGDIGIGLQIGKLIQPLKLTVVVDGICASSCANYIFTAAAQKRIKRGWVGFHGDVNAFIGAGWPHQVQVMKKEGGLSDDAIAVIRQEQLLPLAQTEQRYLASLGISQALFDKSQLGADSGAYTMLCPTPATFASYGITNVIGQQNPTFGMPTDGSMLSNAVE